MHRITFALLVGFVVSMIMLIALLSFYADFGLF
jgi:hypothetical protein